MYNLAYGIIEYNKGALYRITLMGVNQLNSISFEVFVFFSNKFLL